MGRTIIIEESVADYISSLYGTYKWQIGVIIGQVFDSKSYKFVQTCVGGLSSFIRTLSLSLF